MSEPTEKEHNILITQDQTIVNGIVTQPDNISIILPNGHAFDIEEIITILQREDARKPARKRVKLTRFTSAFKKALKECMTEPMDYVIK